MATEESIIGISDGKKDEGECSVAPWHAVGTSISVPLSGVKTRFDNQETIMLYRRHQFILKVTR